MDKYAAPKVVARVAMASYNSYSNQHNNSHSFPCGRLLHCGAPAQPHRTTYIVGADWAAENIEFDNHLVGSCELELG
jgi:hypothetical protein